MSTPLRKPPARRLRVYAFDPNASLDLASAKFSHATISLPWEEAAGPGDVIDAKGSEGKIFPGPINEYLEVVDIDPASNQFYEPLDLNAPEVLAQDGLPPSEGDPRFHQQMVFAVVMNTIKLFERALGRKVIWRPQWNETTLSYEATPRLRVYPHALREANAYYSPQKRALLFGYFNAKQRSAGASWIFSALSHDIIVHETTHAILDGLHPRYSEPTGVDSLAFHEAFADIAALFSHFQLYEAVYDFIADSGGGLNQSGLLSGLAGQFAKGTTGRASLRDYIDKDPDPDLIASTHEPHDRGAILVAAVFDAFLSIYTARTEDLLRISGTRLGAEHHLHPDLVARLTKEATKSADHVLRMCIRALDYLPPVDVEFGEFLRAIITADTDLIPDDRLNYRLAFVEAFRRRGIFPEACLSMSPDNLLWDEPSELLATNDIMRAGLDLTPIYKRHEIAPISERNRLKVWYWLSQPSMTIGGRKSDETSRLEALLTNARQILSSDPGRETPLPEVAGRLVDAIQRDLLVLGVRREDIRELRAKLGVATSHIAQWDGLLGFLQSGSVPTLVTDERLDRAWEEALGLYFQRPSARAGRGGRARRGVNPLYTIEGTFFGLKVEVHSVRATRRAGPDGQDIRQLVVEVTQRRAGYVDEGQQKDRDSRPGPTEDRHFTFRGGATLIIDLKEGALRYVVRKSIGDEARLARQREFLMNAEILGFTNNHQFASEPFAMLHRG